MTLTGGLYLTNWVEYFFVCTQVDFCANKKRALFSFSFIRIVCDFIGVVILNRIFCSVKVSICIVGQLHIYRRLWRLSQSVDTLEKMVFMHFSPENVIFGWESRQVLIDKLNLIICLSWLCRLACGGEHWTRNKKCDHMSAFNWSMIDMIMRMENVSYQLQMPLQRHSTHRVSKSLKLTPVENIWLHSGPM